jgi:hypothetical protein
MQHLQCHMPTVNKLALCYFSFSSSVRQFFYPHIQKETGSDLRPLIITRQLININILSELNEKLMLTF